MTCTEVYNLEKIVMALSIIYNITTHSTTLSAKPAPTNNV